MNIFKFYDYENSDLITFCNDSSSSCRKAIGCYILYHRGLCDKEPAVIIKEVLRHCKKLDKNSREELLFEYLVVSFENIKESDLASKLHKLSLLSIAKLYAAFTLRNEDIASYILKKFFEKYKPNSELSEPALSLVYLYNLILKNLELYQSVRDPILNYLMNTYPQEFWQFTNNNYFLPLYSDMLLEIAIKNNTIETLHNIIETLNNLISLNSEYEWVKVSFFVKYIPFAIEELHKSIHKYLEEKIDLLPFPINKTYGTVIRLEALSNEEEIILNIKKALPFFYRFSQGDSIIARNFNRSYNYLFDRFYKNNFLKTATYISNIAKGGNPFHNSIINNLQKGEILIDIFGYDLTNGDDYKSYISIISPDKQITIKKEPLKKVYKPIDIWIKNSLGQSGLDLRTLKRIAKKSQSLIFDRELISNVNFIYLSLPPEFYYLPSSILTYGKRHIISQSLSQLSSPQITLDPSVLVINTISTRQSNYARLEADIIKSIFPQTIILNKNSPKNKILKLIQESDIIHIISHATDYETIILGSNRKLKLKEIEKLHLTKAKLVFINRCYGAIHQKIDNNAILKSFPYYFLKSGVKFIITTPLVIEDKTAFNFAKNFYQQLKVSYNIIDAFYEVSKDTPLYSIISR